MFDRESGKLLDGVLLRLPKQTIEARSNKRRHEVEARVRDHGVAASVERIAGDTSVDTVAPSEREGALANEGTVEELGKPVAAIVGDEVVNLRKPEDFKLIVIESPFAGDTTYNLGYLKRCVRDAIERGESPYASHKMIPGSLDDDVPHERELGIAAGLAWSRVAHPVFYVDEGWSGGMKEAREFYRANKISFTTRSLEEGVGDVTTVFDEPASNNMTADMGDGDGEQWAASEDPGKAAVDQIRAEAHGTAPEDAGAPERRSRARRVGRAVPLKGSERPARGVSDMPAHLASARERVTWSALWEAKRAIDRAVLEVEGRDGEIHREGPVNSIHGKGERDPEIDRARAREIARSLCRIAFGFGGGEHSIDRLTNTLIPMFAYVARRGTLHGAPDRSGEPTKCTVCGLDVVTTQGARCECPRDEERVPSADESPEKAREDADSGDEERVRTPGDTVTRCARCGWLEAEHEGTIKRCPVRSSGADRFEPRKPLIDFDRVKALANTLVRLAMGHGGSGRSVHFMTQTLIPIFAYVARHGTLHGCTRCGLTDEMCDCAPPKASVTPGRA
jgi:hypothetical protein